MGMWPSLHPFIIRIGVAADAAKMTDSSILLLYFVRSSRIINKMSVCISQMQRPGVILLFEKKPTQARETFGNGKKVRDPSSERRLNFVF